MKKQAIVAGHICIDITPVFPAGTNPVRHVGDLMVPGKLLCVERPDIHTGGAVANTGLGMKILGAEVTLMGKVGKDAFGGMVQNILRDYRVDGGLLVDPQSSTSYSIVVALPGVDRIFLHHSGANDTFCSGDVPEEALENAALFHFGYPPLMRAMYENGGSDLAALFARVKAKGIATSLDLAAVDAASRAGQADWREILAKTLPFVDFFVPSFEELCFMLDREKYENLLREAAGGDMTAVLDIQRDVRPLAEQAIRLGAKAVLLKCGKPGLFLLTSEKMAETGRRLGLDAEAWNSRSIFERSYLVENVVSGTGAGDTSIAAFLTALLNGERPEEAMHLAAAAGALCIQDYDAVSGLKPLAEIKRLIAAGWKKYEE